MSKDKYEILSTNKLQVLLGFALAGGGVEATTSDSLRELSSHGISFSISHASTVRKRLEASGLLKRSSRNSVESGIRQFYKVTEKGLGAIEASANEYRRLLNLINLNESMSLSKVRG